MQTVPDLSQFFSPKLITNILTALPLIIAFPIYYVSEWDFSFTVLKLWNSLSHNRCHTNSTFIWCVPDQEILPLALFCYFVLPCCTGAFLGSALITFLMCVWLEVPPPAWCVLGRDNLESVIIINNVLHLAWKSILCHYTLCHPNFQTGMKNS